MKPVLKIICLCLLLSCAASKKNAKEIIEKAIQAAGGEKFENSVVEFDFRDHHYLVERKGGDWRMERSKSDSTGTLLDVYSPNEFIRSMNDSTLSPPDSMIAKYQESINSVFYFALLPYKLDDAAVISKRLQDEKVEGKDYYKMEIRFQEEGGGEDFQDVFLYWFDQADYSLDFLAYSFQVNGGGARFRKAINERRIGGIRFVDYINFKAPDNLALSSLAKVYERGELEELARIELENLEVR